MSAWAFVAFGLLAVIDTLAGFYARPMNPTFNPGMAYLIVGIALLTLRRGWRLVALVTLAFALVVAGLIGIMTAVSPEHGAINIPVFNVSIPVTEKPRWAAVGVVLMAIAFVWPGYLLLSAKAKALFGLARPK